MVGRAGRRVVRDLRGQIEAGDLTVATLANTKVKVIAEFPADSYPPIVYPVAIVAG